MGVAGTFFEPHLWISGNLLLFGRCTNHISITFWFFWSYKSCKKCWSLPLQVFRALWIGISWQSHTKNPVKAWIFLVWLQKHSLKKEINRNREAFWPVCSRRKVVFDVVSSWFFPFGFKPHRCRPGLYPLPPFAGRALRPAHWAVRHERQRRCYCVGRVGICLPSFSEMYRARIYEFCPVCWSSISFQYFKVLPTQLFQDCDAPERRIFFTTKAYLRPIPKYTDWMGWARHWRIVAIKEATICRPTKTIRHATDYYR